MSGHSGTSAAEFRAATPGFEVTLVCTLHPPVTDLEAATDFAQHFVERAASVLNNRPWGPEGHPLGLWSWEPGAVSHVGELAEAEAP